MEYPETKKMPGIRSAIAVAVLAVISPLLSQTGYPRGSSRSPYGAPSTVPSATAAAPGRNSPKSGAPPEAPLATFRGTVQGAGPKILVVKTTAADAVDFECSKKTTYERAGTKVKAADVKPGDLVAVEARHTIDGKVMAVNVILDPPPEPKSQDPSEIDAYKADVEKHKPK